MRIAHWFDEREHKPRRHDRRRDDRDGRHEIRGSRDDEEMTDKDSTVDPFSRQAHERQAQAFRQHAQMLHGFGQNDDLHEFMRRRRASH